MITELVPLIMLGITTLVLIVGVVIMMFGNKLNVKYSTKLMSMRVVAQALTVIAFAALYYFQKH